MSHAMRMALAGGMLALAGCGGAPPPAPPPPPPTLALTVTGGAHQNPTASGAAAPVSVRLFQLSAAGRFEKADVFALADRPVATLGPDLLGSDEFVLAPGEVHPVAGPVKPGASVLGVVVLFRDIDHATWRVSAPLAANGPSRLALGVDGLAATLAVVPAPAAKGAK